MTDIAVSTPMFGRLGHMPHRLRRYALAAIVSLTGAMPLFMPSSAHAVQGEETEKTSVGSTRTMPWSAPDVYRAVFENINRNISLDPDSITTILLSTRVKPQEAVRIEAQARIAPYSCNDNIYRLPAQYLSRLCSSDSELQQYTYFETPPAGDFYDGRRANMSQQVLLQYEIFKDEIMHLLDGKVSELVNVTEHYKGKWPYHTPYPYEIYIFVRPGRNEIIQLTFQSAGTHHFSDEPLQSMAVYSAE